MNKEQIIRGLDGNYNQGEKRFQEELKLRSMRYGFHQKGEPKGNVLCSVCSVELNGCHTLINGIPFCTECLCARNKNPK